jgi:hypothetical protein
METIHIILNNSIKYFDNLKYTYLLELIFFENHFFENENINIYNYSKLDTNTTNRITKIIVLTKNISINYPQFN